MMENRLINVGVAFIVLGFVLGAFGAHGLKSFELETSSIESFDTGVKYLIYNGLGFIALAGVRNRLDFMMKFHFRSIMWGTILFSGSIFSLVLLPVVGIDINKFIAPVTPFGGALFIIGWGTILIKHLRNTI